MWTSAAAQVRRLGLLVHPKHSITRGASQSSYSVLSALRLKHQEIDSSKHLLYNNYVSSRGNNSNAFSSDGNEVPIKLSGSPVITDALPETVDKPKADSIGLDSGFEMNADDINHSSESLLSTTPLRPPSEDDHLPTERRSGGGGAPIRSHGLAPFVAASADLRRLLELGVDVSGWDRRPGVAQMVLRLDWQRDMAPRIQFLHDAGVPADKLASFITRNPLIFKERIEDLQVRAGYLAAKRFSREQVASVLSRDPFWLMFSTARIDRRLGLFSGLFGLSACELRQLAARCPGLITSNVQHVKDSVFTIKEEFGFDRSELKQIVLGKPKVFMLSRWALQDRLQYLHNEMGLSHQLIADSPNVLTYRSWRVRQRHLMLNMLQRDQYDRSRPGFVSLDRLVGTTDQEFCRDVAQVPVASYNEFLKTL